MRKLEEIAGCMIVDNGKILMVRESWQDYWKIPSGKREPNEPPERTAIRETKEETGLDVTITNDYGIYDFSFKRRNFRLYLYGAVIKNGEISPRKDIEETINEVAWLRLNELTATQNNIPSNRIVLSVYNEITGI